MVILIIRHCDKPHDKHNPCCSDIGYKRAKYRKDYFKDINFTIYTAGFRTEPNQCLKDFSYMSNKYCQHSQRMLLTANIIGKPIKYQYCIGDEKKLVHDVMKQKENSLIIWQHKGIYTILDYLNISNHHIIDTSLYGQVIMINTDTQLMSSSLIEMSSYSSNNNIWIYICIFFTFVFGIGFCIKNLCLKINRYIPINI
jgi:hypothetical protein